MKRETLAELYKKYELTKDHIFKHKHYTIINRLGIDRIQALESIFIHYDVITATPEFCLIKATAEKGGAKIQTFGSAKYGGKEWVESKTQGGKGRWLEHGNTETWYIGEMAEKRAMSRAILKLTGFYEHGVFSEDEFGDINKNKAANMLEDIIEKFRHLPEGAVPEDDMLNIERIISEKDENAYRKVLVYLNQFYK